MKKGYFSEKDNFGWCGGKGEKGGVIFFRKVNYSGL